MLEEDLKPNGKLSGQLIINNDSLIIHPASKEHLETFQATKGIQLKKDDTLYALLLKASDISKTRIVITKRPSLEE